MVVYRDSAPRSIRFFCVVGPTGLRIADIGYEFLRAVIASGMRVRALPIGPGGAFMNERRWYELGSTFTRPMSLPFVNVVCARAGDVMGQTAPASTFAKVDALPAELRAVLGPMAGGKSADVDYVPQTVFAGLFTVGVPNVAIVVGVPDARELVALARYDLVVWPDATDEDTLRARHVAPLATQSWYIPTTNAARFPEILREVLRCEFATSATSEPSPATAAPPATTSPPSPPPASSSRSQRLAIESPRQSRAISTWIGLRARGCLRRVRAMWRSIMASLAFWRRSRTRASKSAPDDRGSR